MGRSRKELSGEEEGEHRKRHRSSSLGRYYKSPNLLGVALTSPVEVTINDAEEEEEEEDVSDDNDLREKPIEETVNIFKMSRDKRSIVITYCITNFFCGLFYSILAPFFPIEAVKKGASHSMIGLIFGSFELVMVAVSPLYGTYLNQIGANFLFTSGIFVSGVCCILFGFLDQSEDGMVFVVLCFVVRIAEAFGAAALGTASFAIMAYNFPNNVATMFGTLEMFTGLGLMVGPPIGGLLYQVGGYVTPFAVCGSLLLAVGVVSYALMPRQIVSQVKEKRSILGLLKMPFIIITCLCLVAGAGIIGFLDTTLAIFLDESFKLSPSLVGLVFLVEPLSYSVMSPIWGRVVDARPAYGPYFITLGYVVAGLSLFSIAPAPFFNLAPNIWAVVISLLVGGLGISTLSITFQIISEEAINAGYSDSLGTYGLIAGLVSSFFSTGAFIGPIGGGALSDAFGFPMATVIIGTITIATALLLLSHTIYTRVRRKNKENNINNSTETLSLLPKNSHIRSNYNVNNNNNNVNNNNNINNNNNNFTSNRSISYGGV